MPKKLELYLVPFKIQNYCPYEGLLGLFFLPLEAKIKNEE